MFKFINNFINHYIFLILKNISLHYFKINLLGSKSSSFIGALELLI
jgi:hypothetical protein